MAHDTFHDYLRQVPLFADLDDDELDAVGQAVTNLDLKAGSVLMHQGTPAHDMVIVVHGTLEVTRDGAHYATITDGGFAGELGLLTHSPRFSTIAAATDVTLLHIDGRAFSALLHDVPQIAVKMLPVVAARAIENADD